MEQRLRIMKMEVMDIDDAKKIWCNQYSRYCDDESFPSYWMQNTELIEKFLKFKIEKEMAIVAKQEDRVVGFLAYDEFMFHGESTVFCPIIGHAALEEYKESAYLKLYESISREWVKRSIFNHMWTIFINDFKLKDILFELGYGSYLIDAFAQIGSEESIINTQNVTRATNEDIDILYELAEESKEYYRDAPLFLKRDSFSRDEVNDLVTNSNVFIAKDKDDVIGVINLGVSDENNFIDMSVIGCGLVNEIGAYIKKEYRNKGIGLELLSAVKKCCRDKGIEYIHVDFETANLYGNKFWKKYFTPMLLSMKRSVNRDADGRK